MTSRQHVVVVENVVARGGLIGLCSAYWLLRAGHRVTIIERDHLGAGAATGNAGELTPQMVAPLGRMMGASWLVYAPSIAIALAMIPYALDNRKAGRTMALLAAAVTMALSILLGLANVGWMLVPSGVLAALAGWLGIRSERTEQG